MPSDIKPWTIKRVPDEVRLAAITAARRENMTQGEWLHRAIRNYLQTDAAATINLPRDRDVFAVLERVADLAPKLSSDALPKRIRHRALALLMEMLRAARC